MEQPLDVTINPIGTRLRSEPRVWNNGQQRLKLVTLSKKVEQAGGATPPRQRRRRVRVTSSDGTPEARKKRTSAVMSTLRL
mmetsp:Transcript_17673/g.53174  ORF Transcript_17673/g.53174 Transcript_17673/m.53174 type:complete len:81 (-) Transcript_17673:467-709(-)